MFCRTCRNYNNIFISNISNLVNIEKVLVSICQVSENVYMLKKNILYNELVLNTVGNSSLLVVIGCFQGRGKIRNS